MHSITILGKQISNVTYIYLYMRIIEYPWNCEPIFESLRNMKYDTPSFARATLLVRANNKLQYKLRHKPVD
jgi:hypothetical protein